MNFMEPSLNFKGICYTIKNYKSPVVSYYMVKSSINKPVEEIYEILKHTFLLTEIRDFEVINSTLVKGNMVLHMCKEPLAIVYKGKNIKTSEKNFDEAYRTFVNANSENFGKLRTETLIKIKEMAKTDLVDKILNRRMNGNVNGIITKANRPSSTSNVTKPITVSKVDSINKPNMPSSANTFSNIFKIKTDITSSNVNKVGSANKAGSTNTISSINKIGSTNTSSNTSKAGSTNTPSSINKVSSTNTISSINKVSNINKHNTNSNTSKVGSTNTLGNVFKISTDITSSSANKAGSTNTLDNTSKAGSTNTISNVNKLSSTNAPSSNNKLSIPSNVNKIGSTAKLNSAYAPNSITNVSTNVPNTLNKVNTTNAPSNNSKVNSANTYSSITKISTPSSINKVDSTNTTSSVNKTNIPSNNSKVDSTNTPTSVNNLSKPNKGNTSMPVFKDKSMFSAMNNSLIDTTLPFYNSVATKINKLSKSIQPNLKPVKINTPDDKKHGRDSEIKNTDKEKSSDTIEILEIKEPSIEIIEDIKETVEKKTKVKPKTSEKFVNPLKTNGTYDFIRQDKTFNQNLLSDISSPVKVEPSESVKGETNILDYSFLSNKNSRVDKLMKRLKEESLPEKKVNISNSFTNDTIVNTINKNSPEIKNKEKCAIEIKKITDLRSSSNETLNHVVDQTMIDDILVIQDIQPSPSPPTANKPKKRKKNAFFRGSKK